MSRAVCKIVENRRPAAGRHGEAISLYRQVLAQSPGNRDARIGLGHTLAWRGRYGAAADIFRQMLVTSPTDTEVEKGLGYVALWHGESGVAAGHFKRLAARFPNDDEYRTALGLRYLAEYRSEAARAEFDRTVQLNPNSTARQFYKAADLKMGWIEADVWEWYQPLSNRYGFVMFLGHGAVLRRRVWDEIGGFPDIVSEDLGFAIHAREKGYTGYFESIYTLDFFLMTMLTFFAPVLCFVLAMARRPPALFRFLSHSTALYASLGTLSTLGVLSFLGSGCKAFFLVTGDKNQVGSRATGLVGGGLLAGLRRRWRDLLAKSHPDHPAIQTAEVLVALGFAAIAAWMFQISFFGLCLGFLLLPLIHHLGWEHWLVKRLVYLPFLLILLGVGVAGMSIAGMQSVFFGYGFHF